MTLHDPTAPTRRRFIQTLLASPLAAAVPAWLSLTHFEEGTGDLDPTPACGDHEEPTPAQTEGPYFTPRSPRRDSLMEAGVVGTALVVAGRVLTRKCEPVSGALLDFWQCDARGRYDNSGYRLRGHQFTDERGAYRLETIMPAVYPGRTRHIHVKVQAPNQPVLTTQLYFADEPANARDRLFHPDLQIALADGLAHQEGLFNFVLALP